MRVGIVGAGRMGWPMATRLREAGHEVVSWRVPGNERPRPLGRARGRRDDRGNVPGRAGRARVRLHRTLRSATRASARTGSCCGCPGGYVVIHTTGSPTTARRWPTRPAPGDRGARCAGQWPPGRCRGGAGDAVRRRGRGELAAVRPVLGAYGSPIIHAGPVGYGQRVKLVNNACSRRTSAWPLRQCGWAMPSACPTGCCSRRWPTAVRVARQSAC